MEDVKSLNSFMENFSESLVKQNEALLDIMNRNFDEKVRDLNASYNASKVA